MVELLVVIGIIAILAAVAVPNLYAFIRSARIRGAAHQVKTQIDKARATAIMKNASNGVVFVTLSNRDYRYVMEDDMVGPPFEPFRDVSVQALIDLPEPNPQAGPPMQLPTGVVFLAGTDPALRFDRLGRWHHPGDASDPFPVTENPAIDAGAKWMTNNRADPNCEGSLIVLDQPETGLRRWICVELGGRSRVSAFWPPAW
jgi:hypothetical protein